MNYLLHRSFTFSNCTFTNGRCWSDYVPVLPCNTLEYACGYAVDAGNICNNGSGSNAETFRASQDTPLGLQVLGGPRPAAEVGLPADWPSSLTVYNSASSTSVTNSVQLQTVTVTPSVTSDLQSHHPDTATKVGAALGACLGLALVATIWLAILLVKTKRKLRETGRDLQQLSETRQSDKIVAQQLSETRHSDKLLASEPLISLDRSRVYEVEAPRQLAEM